MQVKSDKLKKLEAELGDLKRWLDLGLVPKKDMPKHEEEIRVIEEKIAEETDRLKFLREHGDLDEYVAPKRQAGKTVYPTEMPTLPDVDVGEGGMTEGFEDSRSTEKTEDTSAGEERDEETSMSEADEESYFSDRARWKRGGIIDPEADDW